MRHLQQSRRNAAFRAALLALFAVPSVYLYLALSSPGRFDFIASKEIRAGRPLRGSQDAGEAAGSALAARQALEARLGHPLPTFSHVAHTAADTLHSQTDHDASPAPERIDAHCLRDNTTDPGAATELFRCRKEAAQQHARAMCQQLETTPPVPPFQRADLSLAYYPPATNAAAETKSRLSIPIYIEAGNDHVSNDIRQLGVWEAEQAQSLGAALGDVQARTSRQAVFLDIGANVGAFALGVAGRGYEVYAFEGVLRNQLAIYSSLCATPELLDRFTMFPFGLGDEDAQCVMMSDPSNVADGHVVCSEELRATMAAARYVERNRMDLVRLHDYLGGVQMGVVKMDVEGFEPKVLAGAGDMFEKHVAYLSVEVNWEALQQKNNGTQRDIADRFVGKLLRAGFEPRAGSLLGPPLDLWPDVDAFMTHIMGHREIDLNLARPAAVTGDAAG